MSEAKFTPGPWEAGRPDMATIIESRSGKYIYAGEKYIAASGFDVADWQEVMANARLIAAAPELLAACQACMEEFNDRYDGAPDAGFSWMAVLMHQLELAIAKVEVEAA